MFHVRDGLGIRMLLEGGTSRWAIVTGRRSMALVHRCRNLGLTLVKDGIRDKAAALAGTSLKKTGVAAAATAFVGDDLTGPAHHAPGGCTHCRR